MADKFKKSIRSFIMSRIKGRNTKAEVQFRRGLFNRGYRYSLRHRFKELNFRPDLTLKAKKACIFIDGCFWHMCPKCFKRPKSNKTYWGPKLKRNAERDRQQTRFLKKNGWKVIRIWEHEVNDKLEHALNKTVAKIRK